MKKNIIIFSVAIGTLFFFSCKKYLQETPYSFLSPTNYYQTGTDAQTALIGVFSIMQAQNYYSRAVYEISELPTDLLYPSSGNQPRADLSALTYQSTNTEITVWWQNCYQMIKNANDLIANVPHIDMDTTYRNNIIGNAKFLRAVGYFDLVRSFGDVPLITTPITSPSDTLLYPHRTPAAIVYQQIIADLKYAELNCFAENIIGTNTGNSRQPATFKGMASSGAASALLARVYLQRSSTSFADAADNQNALAECNTVINSGLYKLIPVYGNLFNPDTKNGPEHIFSIQFGLPPNTGNILVRMMLPSALGGAGSFLAQTAFATNGYFKSDTTRLNWNIYKSSTTKYYFYKYRDNQWVANSNNSRCNWNLIRYADVLLMQSEAINNIDPTNPAKFAGVDSVRSRAKIPSSAFLNMTNTPTQANFVDSLLAERARELCDEGHRRWDLIRMNRYAQTMSKLGITVDANHLLFPIPYTEMQANPNLVQNPGW